MGMPSGPTSTVSERRAVWLSRGGPIERLDQEHPVRRSILTSSSQRDDQAEGAPSATCQLELGLRFFKTGATFDVFCPRSFSYTTPSCVTMKVMTPDDPYSAGYA